MFLDDMDQLHYDDIQSTSDSESSDKPSKQGKASQNSRDQDAETTSNTSTSSGAGLQQESTSSQSMDSDAIGKPTSILSVTERLRQARARMHDPKGSGETASPHVLNDSPTQVAVERWEQKGPGAKAVHHETGERRGVTQLQDDHSPRNATHSPAPLQVRAASDASDGSDEEDEDTPQKSDAPALVTRAEPVLHLQAKAPSPKLSAKPPAQQIHEPLKADHLPDPAKQRRSSLVHPSQNHAAENRRHSVGSSVASSTSRRGSACVEPEPLHKASELKSQAMQHAEVNKTPASSSTADTGVAMATTGPPPARIPSPRAKPGPKVFTRAQQRRPSVENSTTAGTPSTLPNTNPRNRASPSPPTQHLNQAQRLAVLSAAAQNIPAPTSPSHTVHTPRRTSLANTIEVDAKALTNSIPQYMLADRSVSPWHMKRKPRRTDPGSPASYPASPSPAMNDEDDEPPAGEDGRTAQYKSEFYENGDSYMGYMLDGVKHGRGVYLFANGSQYKGNWCDGAMHGWGIFLEQETGDRFEGEWVDGERAFGVYYYNNGDMYHGGFQDNKKQGRGVVWEKRLMYEVIYNQDICVEKCLWSLTGSRDATKERGWQENMRRQRESLDRANAASQKLRQKNAILAEKVARLELLLQATEDRARERRPPMTTSGQLAVPRRGTTHSQPGDISIGSNHFKRASMGQAAVGHSSGRAGRQPDRHRSSSMPISQGRAAPAGAGVMSITLSPWKQDGPRESADVSLVHANMDVSSSSDSGTNSPFGNSLTQGSGGDHEPSSPLAHCCSSPFGGHDPGEEELIAPAKATVALWYSGECSSPNGVITIATPVSRQDTEETEPFTSDLHPVQVFMESSRPSSTLVEPLPTSNCTNALPKRKGKALSYASPMGNSHITATSQIQRSGHTAETSGPGGPRRMQHANVQSRLLCPTAASTAKVTTKVICRPSENPRSPSSGAPPLPRSGSPPQRHPRDPSPCKDLQRSSREPSPRKELHYQEPSPRKPLYKSNREPSPVKDMQRHPPEPSPQKDADGIDPATGLSSSLLSHRPASPPPARKAKPLDEYCAYDMSAQQMRDVFRFYNNTMRPPGPH